MARISFPERGLGEHVDWALLRPEMAVGMGALSKAVYENTQLALRERESARWTIALINAASSAATPGPATARRPGSTKVSTVRSPPGVPVRP